MSYALELKDIIFSSKVPPKRIVAAVYARVSTRNESQRDSCDNQVRTAQDFVDDHTNISLSVHNTYVDNGVSGKSVTHRPAYQKMMKAVNNHEVQLIIAKTCSRLFRSVIEAQVFLNTLICHNVVLLTLEDSKVWDFENQGDVMMFTLLSVFNANTSKVQSDAGKDAQKRRIRDGKLSSKDLVQGYKWDSVSKEMEINPITSKYIVKIFEEYVYRNGTPASICQMLKTNNITFPQSRRDPHTKESYVENVYISERTISNIILNTKYIGLFPINQRSSKFIAGADSIRFKLPKEEWVIIERPDLQIIDKELFEMAQRIHRARINVYAKPDKKAIQARFQGTHKYAGKIFCPICGKPYHFGYSDRKQTVPVYRIKSHSDCPNPVSKIGEQDLEELTKQALKQVLGQQNEVCDSLVTILTECVKASQKSGNEISNLKQQLKNKETQLNNLIDELSEGGLIESAKERIKCRINEITAEVNNLSKMIDEKGANQLSDSYVPDKIAKIKTAIEELRNFTSIDRERILNYIDRIELPPNGDVDILLKAGHTITINTQIKCDILSENSVGKKGKQDVPYS